MATPRKFGHLSSAADERSHFGNSPAFRTFKRELKLEDLAIEGATSGVPEKAARRVVHFGYDEPRKGIHSTIWFRCLESGLSLICSHS